MTLDLLANVILTGMLTGLVYGLMAMGLSVIFGVMRVVNFAHGDFLVLAMYSVLVFANQTHLHPLLALPIVSLFLFAGGYVLQRAFVNRYLNASEHVQFLLLLGVAMIVTNGCMMIFGPDAKGVQVDESFESYAFGTIILDKVRVMAGVLAGACTAALWMFFQYSRTGKCIRACADNRLGALVVGLDVHRLFAVTFGLGAACLGATGCLLLLLTDVNPHLSTDFTLLAFIIVIVGGLGSFSGALLGGVLVGLSEALSGFLISPSLKSMFSFGLLILVLLIRPQGLLGKKA